MHDYELNRLNTRSFEQLVQALAAEVIGPGLTVFGDGPDGGREATFEGSLKCPPSRKPWNGLGILQAKFRQQPESEPKKNADWAIQQLKTEFKNFAPRPKRQTRRAASIRLCPHYYIFATNISLSSVPKRGGKDRVRAVLESYKESHGLKDYAVWDGDQIRRFLDASPGIRTTYAAWVLPGDVLSEMMRVLRLDAADFPSVMRRYLESELLDDQFARLGQGGYTDAKNIPLSAVFIDVPVEKPRTSSDEARSTFLNLFLEEAGQVLKPSLRGKKQSDLRAGRVVLIGGPGQGKTTVGQYASQLFRAELLRATGGPFSPEVQQALHRLGETSGGLPRVSARRYPLRVDLKNVAASLASDATDRATNLFDYLLKRIGARTNSKPQAEDFRGWLAGYPWLLVLDGLDEVPTSSNRQQLMQAIRDFISVESHGADADLLVLATTRPQGYSDEFDPSLYRHLTLAPLSAAESLTYGSLLAEARHPGQRTRIEELTASLTRATTNEATVRLMQSPLQVTIMLALIEGGGEPPEQRWKLFHDYYNVIYRREKERGTPYSTILGRYEPDIHWIHKRAGWLLQQRNAEPGRTGDRLSHAEFEIIADRRLSDVGHDDESERRDLVRNIRLAATDRLVLLVGTTENEIGFEIRSLQEFMAAEHCFDGGEACVHKTLHAIAPHSYWRNVFMFIAGRVFFERQELIDTVYGVLSEMNEEPDAARRAILTGSRLAVGLLKDGAARNQPGATRVIARCAARALDLRDHDAVSNVADVFTGHAEEVMRTELIRRLNESGGAFPDHSWFVCFWVAEAGKKWAQDATVNFPWRGEGARQLIDTYGATLPAIFWRALAPHLFSHPLWTYREVIRPVKEGGSGELLRSTPLATFSALIWQNYRERTVTVPVFVGRRPMAIHLSLPGQETRDLWARLDYQQLNLPEAHPVWRVYEATSLFARNPSRSTLESGLAIIREADPTGSSHLADNMPWQIAVPLRARRSGLSWDQVIQRVSAGCLGTEVDWQRWEAELQEGTQLADLRARDEMTVSDDYKGLVIGQPRWMYSYDTALVDLTQITQALRKCRNITPAESLIDICFFILEHPTRSRRPNLVSNSLSDRQVSDAALRSLLEVCSELGIRPPSSSIPLLILSELTISDKRDLLSRVGRQGLRRPWHPLFDDSTELDDRLGSELPELLGSSDQAYILRALSFLPPLRAMQRLKGAPLDSLSAQDGELSKAASILKSSSLDWTIEEVPQLVTHLRALQPSYPHHIRQLNAFVEQSGDTSPELETFFLEFMTQSAAAGDIDLLGTSTSTLVKLLDRRSPVSCLPETARRNSRADW